MTFIIEITSKSEGYTASYDYDIYEQKEKLLSDIETYMIHLYAGESMTLSCTRRDDGEIIMPIDPAFEDAILTRRKTSIIHKECKGNPGDSFSAFGRRYRLTYTHKLPLWMLAANDYYRECEGVRSASEMIAAVRRYCPDALGVDPMCIHIFREVWE